MQQKSPAMQGFEFFFFYSVVAAVPSTGLWQSTLTMPGNSRFLFFRLKHRQTFLSILLSISNATPFHSRCLYHQKQV